MLYQHFRSDKQKCYEDHRKKYFNYTWLGPDINCDCMQQKIGRRRYANKAGPAGNPGYTTKN